MPVADLRKVPGTRVHAKASLITNPAECARICGLVGGKALVKGTVKRAEARKKSDASKASAAYVVADWYIGDRIKEASVFLGGVKVGDPPARTDQLPRNPAQQQQQGGQEEQQQDPPQEQEQEQQQAPPPPPQEQQQQQQQQQEQQQPSPTGNRGIDQHPPGLACSPHGTNWCLDHNGTLQHDVGGAVPFKKWFCTSVTGERLEEASDRQKQHKRLDYLLFMFPPKALRLMVEETNVALMSKGLRPTAAGEMLKFFGLLVLSTRYEFSGRRSLWAAESPFKHKAAPAFGRTGMARQRFDDLFSCIRFGKQPAERPAGMSSSVCRWLLIDGFVELFNEHREKHFSPSDLLAVDESISRWCGQGGGWINHGLPMHIAIDRKPEDGCEIQDACCGRSGIMLRLKVVKSEEDDDHEASPEDANLPHGGQVLKELVMPWAHTDRIVCADSCFASFSAAQALLAVGLRFIGVIKTATRHCPCRALGEQQLGDRGDTCSLLHKNADGRPTVFAFVHVDRDRHCFVCTASSMRPGRPCVRTRWRQVNQEPNADPDRVDVTVQQPVAAELHFSACGMIDRHNRIRQDDLKLERKVGTQTWDKRVGLSIFGVIMADAHLLYSKCTGDAVETKDEFFTFLAEEMIDNDYDGLLQSRATRNRVSESPTTAHVDKRSGVASHLTPAKRRRRDKDGDELKHAAQGKCRICKTRRTTHCCSTCMQDGVPEAKAHCCRGEKCCMLHVRQAHDGVWMQQ